MTFNLNFLTSTDDPFELALDAGEMIFVLGANGTGKSSLMHRFASQNQNQVRKIAAHRQTWMNSDALDMTPANKVQTEQHMLREDSQERSRYRDSFAAQRASMTIYELIDAENVRARAIASAYDQGEMEKVADSAKVEAPISVINDLLRQSNIPIIISIQANERVMASKNGGPEYSAAQLSDGERNALLIAVNVLTAAAGNLIIVDEPERHLHRAIIAPLLSQLFEKRPDCGFVISTHDHDLPIEVEGARTLLIRSCSFNGASAQGWEADELLADAPLDDTLKRDLLGSRRKMLFVEGTESSLDKPLYSLIFPMVSVIPKGNCKDVEQAVVGVKAGEGFHWLRAFGIADGDGYQPEQIQSKLDKGIYLVPYYSVEAIYFHHEIIARVSERNAVASGGDATAIASSAIAAGVAEIKDHTERLSRNITKKSVRKLIVEQIPNDDELLNGLNLNIQNDATTMLASRSAELDAAVASGDWEKILQTCSVRESGALTKITAALGFRTIADYEKAVRHLLSVDSDALDFVRSLFGNLSAKLEI